MGSRRVALIGLTVLMVWTLGVDDARADLGRQIRQLRSSDNFKVRLSAALSLGKTRDRRAVVALARALERDSSATIRRVAVDSLKKILSRAVSSSVSRLGLAALEKAASSDRDRKVRRAAKRAHGALTRDRSSGGPFVALGKPSDPKRRGPRGIGSEISSTLTSTVRRSAPALDIFSLGKSPRRRGWFIGASISDVSVSRRGGSAEVRCAVTVRVSPVVNGKERFIAGETASARGAARVTGGASRSDVDESKRQCLTAVVEQVTERQVMPFIRRQAARRVAGK